MARLNYSGDINGQTKSETTTLIGTLHDYSEADNGVNIDSISLRLRESGVSVYVSLSSSGTVSELESLADTIAQGAVNIGMEPDVQTARSSIEINGGMD